MPKHFGVLVREKSDGMKLTRENYIRVSNKSSFRKEKVYPDSYISKHKENCLYNYDLNMNNFNSFSKEDFNEELLKFLDKTRKFKEVKDLYPFKNVTGYYILVLDEYSQVYIGRSIDIKKRIQAHWSRQMPFDRLVFGDKDKSVLSIDSFRAYDTTRIFVYPTKDYVMHEDSFINLINPKYVLNRTKGGELEGGLMEAIVHRKTRELK